MPAVGARFEQRALNFAVGRRRPDVDRALDRVGGETGFVARDRQHLDVVELAPQREHLTVAMRDLESVSGLQELQRTARVRQRNHRGEIREAQAVATEQDFERVAAFHEQVEDDARRLGRYDRRAVSPRPTEPVHRDTSDKFAGSETRRRARLARSTVWIGRTGIGLTRRTQQQQRRADEWQAETESEQRPSGSAWAKLRRCLCSRGGCHWYSASPNTSPQDRSVL